MSEIYETQPGLFVVADAAGWIPGVYKTRVAAVRAAKRGKGKLPRIPENFPHMKHRARGRLIYSTGGGYVCTEHGIDWQWGKVTLPEYLAIQSDIEDHEIYFHDTSNYWT